MGKSMFEQLVKRFSTLDGVVFENLSDDYTTHCWVSFPNGYFFSAIRNRGEYGSEYGLIDIAVYDSEDKNITHKVFPEYHWGRMSWTDVVSYVEKTAALPKVP